MMTDSEFLERLANDLRTQDGMDSERGPSHATAHPVYQVQEKRRIFGIDYACMDPDGFVFVNEGEEYHPEEDETLPDDVEKAYYIETWEFVQGAVALTRRGIEGYLAANGHNLCEPRIFIGSMNRCPEMIRLVKILAAGGAS